MLKPYEEVFVDFLVKDVYMSSSDKIALVGEAVQTKAENAICKAIIEKKSRSLENITIFTARNKFKVSDGERFDFIIGCRPCDAEQTILESVSLYNKRFVIMPCVCGGLGRKVVNYIRKYPAITDVESMSEKHKRWGWLFLFNKP